VALGISMVKLSRVGMGKCLVEGAAVPVADGGESSVEDGDMLWTLRSWRVDDVMGKRQSDATDQALRRLPVPYAEVVRGSPGRVVHRRQQRKRKNLQAINAVREAPWEVRQQAGPDRVPL